MRKLPPNTVFACCSISSRCCASGGASPDGSDVAVDGVVLFGGFQHAAALDLYHGDWQGDVTRIYRDFAY